MSRRPVSITAWLFVFVAALAGAAAADEFHYNNFLIGDRASGMGGAYTAVSDDASGLYYNPAGIVYATGRNLSASVNAYYNMTKTYDNVIGGNGWERKATSLLPNFFGILQPLGQFKFGFSYAVPDSIKEDQDQAFYGSLPTSLGSPATRYIINFNNEDNSYLIGPSLAKEVNAKLAVGMTLYVYHRSNQSILNQNILLADGRYEWSNQYIEKVERGYKPIVGLMWTPMEKLSIGLSVGRIFVYSGSMDSQTTVKDADATTPDEYTMTFESDTTKKKYPNEVRLGAAYFVSNALLVSFDTTYYDKVSDPVHGDRVSVVNAAIGTEYYWSRSWALRGGIFSNMANTPELDPSRYNQDEKVDLYGLSLSVSNFSRNTSITLGGSLTTGSGKAQVLSGSTDIQDVDVFGWSLYLSSSYSY